MDKGKLSSKKEVFLYIIFVVLCLLDKETDCVSMALLVWKGNNLFSLMLIDLFNKKVFVW